MATEILILNIKTNYTENGILWKQKQLENNSPSYIGTIH